VGRVLDEPFLRVAGGGQPGEHGVERRREAGHLVGPVHEHLPVDAPVHADVLGDAGQRLEAAGDAPGQQPADAGRDDEHSSAGEGDLVGHVREHVLGVVDDENAVRHRTIMRADGRPRGALVLRSCRVRGCHGHPLPPGR